MTDPFTGLRFSLPRDGGVEFGVVSSPGSSRSLVAGVMGGDLKVRVRAAPERGKANREIEEVIARALGVGRSKVRVSAGAASRRKRVRVEIDPRSFAAKTGGQEDGA